MNSLYQQLNQNKTENWAAMFKQSRDPKSLSASLMMTNPQVASVMNDIQANGGDAKGLFYKRANEMGVNPETIINMLS
jgi:hypothetical protein